MGIGCGSYFLGAGCVLDLVYDKRGQLQPHAGPHFGSDGDGRWVQWEDGDIESLGIRSGTMWPAAVEAEMG